MPSNNKNPGEMTVVQGLFGVAKNNGSFKEETGGM